MWICLWAPFDRNGWKGGPPPVHMIPGYAPDQRQSYHIRDVRGDESTKRERKRTDKEGGGGGGGGLPKLRLRSWILSHSFFTAPHAEDREREREGETEEGRTKRKKNNKKRGSSETTMAISKTSQLEIVSDHSPLPPASTTARSMQPHNRQSPDEWGAVPGPGTKWGSSSSKTPVSSQLSRLSRDVGSA